MPPPAKRPRRIGIVGAGVMGITSALFLLRRNVEVIIFEATDHIGGVWVDGANKDSCLQIGGDHYRPRWPEIDRIPGRLKQALVDVSRGFVV